MAKTNIEQYIIENRKDIEKIDGRLDKLETKTQVLEVKMAEVNTKLNYLMIMLSIDSLIIIVGLIRYITVGMR